MAALARAAAVELTDEGVEDAALEGSASRTEGGIVDIPGWVGDVVPAWSVGRSGLDASARLDERVEDADRREFEFGVPGEIVDVPEVSGGVVSTWLTGELTVLTSGNSSLGRERASATTFAFPRK